MKLINDKLRKLDEHYYKYIAVSSLAIGRSTNNTQSLEQEMAVNEITPVEEINQPEQPRHTGSQPLVWLEEESVTLQFFGNYLQ